MKNQGQKITMMKKIQKWVDDYVEKGKDPISSMDQKKKNHFKSELLDRAEAIIEQRRGDQFRKNLVELQSFANPKMNYQKKLIYIEGSIERDI